MVCIHVRAARSNHVDFSSGFALLTPAALKNPGVSLTAILSLALGIGATVSVFSLIYSVLMNPWPYQGADRIANIALLDKSGDGQGYGLNGPQTRDLAKAKSLEYVVAFNGWNLTVTGSDVPEDVQAMYFTGNVFQMLGCPRHAGAILPAIRRSGRTGTATGRCAELQVLEAPLQRRPVGRRQDHTAGAQKLQRDWRHATPFRISSARMSISR
jgi:hypothetical protein